jgi:hypothetical protein
MEKANEKATKPRERGVSKSLLTTKKKANLRKEIIATKMEKVKK